MPMQIWLHLLLVCRKIIHFFRRMKLISMHRHLLFSIDFQVNTTIDVFVRVLGWSDRENKPVVSIGDISLKYVFFCRWFTTLG